MDDSRKGRKRFFDGLFDDDFFDGVLDDSFHRRIHERVNNFVSEAFQNTDGVLPGKSYVYGFNMHAGPDGKPVFEEFGDVPTPSSNDSVSSIGREPLIEVIPSDEFITVIAELPGVEKTDIDLKADERNLIISVDTESRKYFKNVNMKTAVDPDSIKAQYKNGILEVKIKPKDEVPKRKSIHID